MSTIQIQKQSTRLQIIADTIRGFEGKYTQITDILSHGSQNNERCVMGAFLSDEGWDGNWDTWHQYEEKLTAKFPELGGLSNGWSALADKNNQGYSFSQLADMVERGDIL